MTLLVSKLLPLGFNPLSTQICSQLEIYLFLESIKEQRENKIWIFFCFSYIYDAIMQWVPWNQLEIMFDWIQYSLTCYESWQGLDNKLKIKVIKSIIKKTNHARWLSHWYFNLLLGMIQIYFHSLNVLSQQVILYF